MECGICRCNAGRAGSSCECGLQDQDSTITDSTCKSVSASRVERVTPYEYRGQCVQVSIRIAGSVCNSVSELREARASQCQNRRQHVQEVLVSRAVRASHRN